MEMSATNVCNIEGRFNMLDVGCFIRMKHCTCERQKGVAGHLDVDGVGGRLPGVPSEINR